MSKKPQRAKAAKSRKDAFETIRNRISEHQLLPGSKLREQEMAAEFGFRARMCGKFSARWSSGG
ncbi:MAG: GntR family transcriptional regulator [Rhizobiales bacterium]|nr:GntR family transcriptional regulator [Hyphomicrobiales bacterium]